MHLYLRDICLLLFLAMSNLLFAQKSMEDYNDGKLTTVEVFFEMGQ